MDRGLLGLDDPEVTWDQLIYAPNPDAYAPPAIQYTSDAFAQPDYGPDPYASAPVTIDPYSYASAAPEFGPAPELYGPPAPVDAYAPSFGVPDFSYQPETTYPTPDFSYDPAWQDVYAPAPDLSYSNLDPSIYQQFGFGAEGGGLPSMNSASQAILQNPQFAESNARFDYTTNPANRTDLDPLMQALRFPVSTIGPLHDFAEKAIEGTTNALTLQNAASYPTGGGNVYGADPGIVRAGADLVLPQTPLDLALMAIPGALAFPEKGLYGALAEGLALGAGDEIQALPNLYKAKNILDVPALSREASDLAGTAGQTVIPRTLPSTAAESMPSGIRLAGASEELPEDAARIAGAEAKAGVPSQVAADAASAPSFPRLPGESDLEYAVRLRTSGLPADQIRAIERANAVAAGQEEQRLADLSSGFYKEQGGLRKAATGLSERMDALKKATAAIRDETTEAVQEKASAAVKALSGEEGALTIPDINLPPTTLKDEATALLGAPRTLKATLDLSAPGRQGLALAFRHPLEWAQSWEPMLKAWASESGMKDVNAEIATMMRPWQDQFGKNIIHLHGVGAEAEALTRVPGFEPQGKGYIANVIRHIPGIENSERAYATFINYQKAKTYDTMARALERSGEKDAKVYEGLGRVIDHALGYGGAPLKGGIAGEAFFSQRFMTSRFQFLTDAITEGLLKGDIQTARAAAENLVAFAGGMGALLFLINESGAAKVNFDPRSTDFGKMRLGGQRIDFGAGFLPMIRTAARALTGEATGTTGDRWSVEPGTEILKFFRNKLAPVPSEIITRLTGEDAIGQPPTKIGSQKFFRQVFAPLIADSVIETYSQTHDPLSAALTGASELVGGGTNTYGVGQAAQQDTAQKVYGKDYAQLYAQQQAALNAELIKRGVNLPYSDRSDPWWSARDDAYARFKADTDPEILNDPMTKFALSLRYENDTELQDSLNKWVRKTYGKTRDEADVIVDKFLSATKLDDYIKAYREDVLKADPGFVQSWLDAYNNFETKYKPPTWARKFGQEPAGVR